MYPFIVADIGGTNARFALVTGKEDQQYNLEHIHILNGSDYASFDDVLAAYLGLLENITPRGLCAAVAGPVSGDHVQMTNLDWSFSCQSVASKFGLDHFFAMNDFAAVAAATSQITAAHLVNIKPGEYATEANKAVFGPGTGLGVAGVVHHNNLWIPLPSEGGHANIAPTTQQEAEIIKAAMTQNPHVSAEVLISGPGLVNLYKAISLVNDTKAHNYSPADVSSKALDNSDETCHEALSAFCAFAGSFAGNLALTYGAKGGVYIAGGIMPRIADFVKASEFATRFKAKGPMSHYVKDIPVDLITHPEIPFTGAAAWFEQQSAK